MKWTATTGRPLTAVRRLDDKAAQALGRVLVCHAHTACPPGDFGEATAQLVHALELSQRAR